MTSKAEVRAKQERRREREKVRQARARKKELAAARGDSKSYSSKLQYERSGLGKPVRRHGITAEDRKLTGLYKENNGPVCRKCNLVMRSVGEGKFICMGCEATSVSR